jgi:hypothetical protein
MVDEFKDKTKDWRFTKQNYLDKFMKFNKVDGEN